MSRDPFKIDGPACISFSGGRSSAYMLWRMIQAHGGTLPADVVVCFANTGKEKEPTLAFVRDCAANWGVPIVWLEFVSRAKLGFEVVSFESAHRKGEPFDRLIKTKQRLPNVVQRMCTEELKVNTIQRYLNSVGLGDADMVCGIRADEPIRIPKLRANGRVLPMAAEGTTKADVQTYWRASPFDLGLPYNDGEGNCDLCFLKPEHQIAAQIQREPTRAIWWARKEKQRGARFHKSRPTYAEMANLTPEQITALGTDEEAIACFCGD